MLLVCFAVALGWLSEAHAHENTPAVLALKEVTQGRFLVRWTAPTPDVPDLVLQFPKPCQINGASRFPSSDPKLKLNSVLDCGVVDLAGEIEFTSQATLGRVGVSVERLDHTESFTLSSGTPPSVAVGGHAYAQQPLRILRDYVELGLSHILEGFDHLLFILGLLLLVRGIKRLLATVTAFTLAHSLTLAAASLELVALPSGPIEICIALSVLLLGLEATQGQQTATRRWPWLVAFGFGLLHGLGFASALSEVGLPKHAVALSLLGFNLGVELGQLLVVGLVLLGYRLLKNHPSATTRIERLATWTLGVCSVFWLLQRVHSWLAEFGIA
jgi:hydrogenase/urease accessory protein HupE